eukprot:4925644-Prymnesium_polylepis.1
MLPQQQAAFWLAFGRWLCVRRRAFGPVGSASRLAAVRQAGAAAARRASAAAACTREAASGRTAPARPAALPPPRAPP